MSELYESVPALENRIAQASPKMICIIGKGIWDNISEYEHRKPRRRDEFEFGLQKNQVFGNVEYVYVMPSTSGLVAGVAKSVKERLWHELAEFMIFDFSSGGKRKRRANIVGLKVLPCNCGEELQIAQILAPCTFLAILVRSISVKDFESE